MQTMLKGILEALRDCHGLNWALCDIRLPNIVVTRAGSWFIIDCEHATRLGDELPDLKLKPTTPFAEAWTDLWTVAQILDRLKEAIEFDDGLEEAHEVLKERTSTASAILKMDCFKDVKCLEGSCKVRTCMFQHS